MTEAQMDALEQLLAEHAVPHEGMSLEMLDGFLSSLVVGPEPVTPGEYLSQVWGNAPGRDAPEQAQQGTAGVMQLWDHIAWRVRQPIDEDADPDAQAVLMPPLALPGFDEASGKADEGEGADPLAGVPEDFPFAAGWANGFLHGVALRPAAWEAWLQGDEDLQEDLALLLALSVVDQDHAREMGIAEEDMLDLHGRLDAAMELPGLLQDLHLRHMEALRPQPIRKVQEPGRNEPCPCGSGHKYKRCCGTGATRH